MHRIALLALVTLLGLAGGCKDKTAAKDPAPMPPTVDTPRPTAPAPDMAPPTPTPPTDVAAPTPTASGASATAVLEAKSGSSVKGSVAFKPVADGVEVTATITGLTPGDHAYHVHEKGDCSAPDATSAGGHFNPDNQPHGAPEGTAHHAGDFGNLTADASGNATKTFVMKGIAIDGGANAVVGKGFIVHEKADDFATQPTGNAGGRVACGVITLDAK